MKDKTGQRPPAGGEWALCKFGIISEGTPAADVNPQGLCLDGFPVYFASSFSDQQTAPKRMRAAWLPSPAQLRPEVIHHNELGTERWYVRLPRLGSH